MNRTDPESGPSRAQETSSCCPVCLARLPARLVERVGALFLEKTCPDHGDFSTEVWNGEPSWKSWNDMGGPDRGQDPDSTPQARGSAATGSAARSDEPADLDRIAGSPAPPRSIPEGCPTECGTCAAHLDKICCVLLEVTSGCDQSCPYCFASAGGDPQAEPDADRPLSRRDPSFSEILEWLSFLRQRDTERPCNIHISGGEPSVRDDLPRIIAAAREMGFPYVQLNTNGRRLAHEPGFAVELARSGLSAVFLQFDGIDDNANTIIRGTPTAAWKEKAVSSCSDAGIPVVLAVTLVPGINSGQVGPIIEYGLQRLPSVKGVHFQPVSYFGRYPNDGELPRITIPGLLREIELQTSGRFKASDFSPSGNGHPACAFHGTFRVSKSGEVTPGPSGAGCGCGKERHILARNFVESKWKLPSDFGRGFQRGAPAEKSGEEEARTKLAGWDEFLDAARRETFSVTGMAFQDAWNLDLERLSRCYVFVMAPGNKLIPFCAYNLSSVTGTTLYRVSGRGSAERSDDGACRNGVVGSSGSAEGEVSHG